VLVHGTSLGAGVTLHTLSTSPLAKKLNGFIVENTFTSLSAMVDLMYPKLKIVKNLLLRNFWDNDKYVMKLPKHLKVLFLTGTLDEITPSYMVKELYKMCPLEEKILKEFPNGMHNNTWFVHKMEYFETVDKFVKSLFK
jgi:fermentation-respiration switch protein FrsA (DUF1100 family)